MNSKRIFSIVFLVAASIGTVICIAGIIQVWRFRATVDEVAAVTLDTLQATVVTTEEALAVIGDLVETTSEDVALIEATVQTVTLTIEDTNQVLESLTTLTGTDLPDTINASQVSLESAQASALLVDDVLSAMTSIPFLRLTKYQPDVPLNVALGEISDSLEPLNPSLANISEGLGSASANLEALERELRLISETTREIGAVLVEASGVIEDYQAITGDLSNRIENMQRVASANVTTTAWILTFFLLALLFSQLGLAERGLAMARGEQWYGRVKGKQPSDQGEN